MEEEFILEHERTDRRETEERWHRNNLEGEELREIGLYFWGSFFFFVRKRSRGGVILWKRMDGLIRSTLQIGRIISYLRQIDRESSYGASN
jgi:hypothetical protein